MGFGGFDIDNFASVLIRIAREMDEPETAAESLKHFGVFRGWAIDEDFIGVANA